MARSGKFWRELGPVARRNLLLTAVSLAGLFALGWLLSRRFATEYEQAAQWVYSVFGFWGLGSVLLISDAVLSPLPPDLLLLTIVKSPLADAGWAAAFGFGVISTLGGQIGYGIGRWLAAHKRLRARARLMRMKSGDLVRRFGTWAVVLGALTPVPYSITCWTAGYLALDWPRFALASLTRIPRFLLYYAVIAASVNF